MTIVTITAIYTVVTGLAFLVSLASYCWVRRTYLLAPKRDVLTRLMGSMYVLTAGMEEHRKDGLAGVAFYSALNEAIVVYGKDADVVDKLTVFKKNVERTSNLLPALRAMAKAADMRIMFSDDLLECPFGPSTKTS